MPRKGEGAHPVGKRAGQGQDDQTGRPDRQLYTVLNHKPEIAEAYLSDKAQVMPLVADGNGRVHEKAKSIIERWEQ